MMTIYALLGPWGLGEMRANVCGRCESTRRDSRVVLEKDEAEVNSKRLPPSLVFFSNNPSFLPDLTYLAYAFPSLHTELRRQYNSPTVDA